MIMGLKALLEAAAHYYHPQGHTHGRYWALPNKGETSAPASDREQILDLPATLAYYDWTDEGAMSVEGGGVALVPNLKTPGTYDLGQTSASNRPTLSGGLTHAQASDQHLELDTSLAAFSNVWLLFLVQTSDTGFMILTRKTVNSYIGRVQAGSGAQGHQAAGSLVPRLDGVDISPTLARDYYSSGIADGNYHTFEADGADLSAWTDGALMGSWGISTSNSLEGKLMLLAVLNKDDITYGDAKALALAEATRQATALGMAT